MTKLRSIMANTDWTHSATTTVAGPDGVEMYRVIPRAAVPVFPTIGSRENSQPKDTSSDKENGQPVSSFLERPNLVYTALGRQALLLILQDLSINAGDEILVPAYHCIALVEPIIAAGAVPIFYRIKHDFSVDMADLEERIGEKTRAAIVINYFGFPNVLGAFRDMCKRANICMIEDCAHSFFGACEGQPIGSFGDYSFASQRKFFPAVAGGMASKLTGSWNDPDYADYSTPRTGIGFRNWARLAQTASAYQRLGLVGSTIRALQRNGKSIAPLPVSKTANHAASSGSSLAKDQTAPQRIDPLSFRLMNQSHMSAQVAARRLRYEQIVSGTGGINGIQALRPRLRPGEVPYLCPLAIENLSEIFPAIENKGIGFQRFGQFLWPEMAEDHCPVASEYAETVLQLPCHQGLLREEIDWQIEQLINTVQEFN